MQARYEPAFDGEDGGGVFFGRSQKSPAHMPVLAGRVGIASRVFLPRSTPLPRGRRAIQSITTSMGRQSSSPSARNFDSFDR
jgi:hypothetical protein